MSCLPESCLATLPPQARQFTFPLDEEEGKFLYFLGVHDAHVPAQLLQHFCCHLGMWTGP